MGNHAILSASSSHRWMNCPPSVRLTEHMSDSGSVYATEGSEAHALCEYKLRQVLGQDAQNPALHFPPSISSPFSMGHRSRVIFFFIYMAFSLHSSGSSIIP